MNTKKLKTILASNELTIGSWLTIGHPDVAEIMAQSGFDWLTIDMEHSAITIGEAKQLIQIIDLAGSVPLVRVGNNESTLIKRVMDAGAHGVIVPMVNSSEEAQQAVAAVKYPPTGTRGVGLARAQGYGFSFNEYCDWVEENSIVIVQIEHIEAVNNLDEILQTEGVDGFFVGPYDLSASMGMPGSFDHPDVLSALSRISEIAKKYSVMPGFHVVPPDPQIVSEKVSEGYKFIGYSVDFMLLGTQCRAGLEAIKKDPF